MNTEIESKLAALGLELPTAPAAVGFYVPVVRTGNLVITSGQLPFVGKQIAFEGKLGDNLHEQDGYNAARLCVLNALAQVKACVGSLDAVRRVVRVEGYVHSAPGFRGQPHVLNGASELLVELFGDAGKHTRVAVGVSEMPLNAAVQLALWVEVE
jgi:enamine deaminase RidA (YjgF/YER057c/UK114 family)